MCVTEIKKWHIWHVTAPDLCPQCWRFNRLYKASQVEITDKQWWKAFYDGSWHKVVWQEQARAYFRAKHQVMSGQLPALVVQDFTQVCLSILNFLLMCFRSSSKTRTSR